MVEMVESGICGTADTSVTVLGEKLKEVAKCGRLICYAEAAVLIGISISSAQGRRSLAKILKEVCGSEIRSGRPMLGSLVVRKDTGMPGTGFFREAIVLGNFAGGSEEDNRSFWSAEVKRVYQYWSGK